MSRAIAIRSGGGSNKPRPPTPASSPDGIRGVLRGRARAPQMRGGNEGCAAELSPHALHFASQSPVREIKNIPDPARKHLSITSVVCGLLVLVRVWSMF